MTSAVASSAPAPPPPLPSTLPSPNARRTSTGFFHSVKRAVLGPSSASTSDEEFSATRADFLQLHSQLSSLRQHVTSYRTAAAAVLGSSLLVANDFADIIRDLPRPHPYSHQLLTLAHAHNDLQEKTAAGGDSAGYGSAVLAAVDAQWQAHKALLARIEERQRLRTEFLYYNKKVEALLAERSKRSRPEKAAETEKVERNQSKLTDSADRFRVFDQELQHELHSLYASRLTVYGPAMLDFVAAERAFVADYDRAMRQVGAKDGSELGLGRSLSVNVDAAAAAANGVLAVHTPQQDGDADSRHSVNPFGSLDPSPIGGLTPTSVALDSAPSDAAAGRLSAADNSYPYEQRPGSATLSAARPAAATAPRKNPFTEFDPFADLMGGAAGAGEGGAGGPSLGAAAGKGEAEAEGRPRVAPFVQRQPSGYHDPFASNGAGANPFFDLGAQASPAGSTPVVSAFVSTSSSSSSSVAPSTARPSAAAGAHPAVAAAVPQYQPVLFLPVEVAAAAPVTADAPSSADVAAEENPGEAEEQGEEETEEEEEEAEGVPHEAEQQSAAAAAPVVPAAAAAAPPPPAAAAPLPAPPAAGIAPPAAGRPPPPMSRPSMPPPARPSMPAAAPLAAHPTTLPAQPPPAHTPSSHSGAAEPNPFDDD